MHVLGLSGSEVIVPQQPYSSKAPPAVYIPEDSWSADQNCKLSHTLGGKNSYTTLSQPYAPAIHYAESAIHSLWSAIHYVAVVQIGYTTPTQRFSGYTTRASPS